MASGGLSELLLLGRGSDPLSEPKALTITAAETNTTPARPSTTCAASAAIRGEPLPILFDQPRAYPWHPDRPADHDPPA